MNEAVLKKEEEEKKKKEEERRMKPGTPFGQPKQAEPAAKNTPAPFAPAAKGSEQAQKQGAEQNQRIFQGLRSSPFGDDLMRETQDIEGRARADYERAVAREKKAILEKAGRKVVVKEGQREEKQKPKDEKKNNGKERKWD
jgi:hypothetical protein